jgi:hypothetical protein
MLLQIIHHNSHPNVFLHIFLLDFEKNKKIITTFGLVKKTRAIGSSLLCVMSTYRTMRTGPLLFRLSIYIRIVGYISCVRAWFATARYWISRLLRILWFRPLGFIQPGDRLCVIQAERSRNCSGWRRKKKEENLYERHKIERKLFLFYLSYVFIQPIFILIGSVMRLPDFYSPSVMR